MAFRRPTKEKKLKNDGDNNDDPNAHVVAFYSTVDRTSKESRPDSKLYHMRKFNNWVKAVQIQELRPRSGDGPLRVLDLACGNGGDLGKFICHHRGIKRYVGVDVVLPSLQEAARRAQAKKKGALGKCTFVCADLGNDVLGQHQILKTWSLNNDPSFEGGERPDFRALRGGGVRPGEKFDVISIQFAIHYMFRTQDRARRFFKTVSELLDVGGTFIATTIDSRVVVDHLMQLGLDFHEETTKEAEDKKEEANVATRTSNPSKQSGAKLDVGGGACHLTFPTETLRRMFPGHEEEEEEAHYPEQQPGPYGLEYLFHLVEGSNQAAGVGDAVNAPEYLVPLPLLKSLAKEAGLDMDHIENFHEFYRRRCVGGYKKRSEASTLAHKMGVANRRGTLSDEEWDICRLYCAIKLTRRPTNRPPAGRSSSGNKSSSSTNKAKQAKRKAGASQEDEQRLVRKWAGMLGSRKFT